MRYMVIMKDRTAFLTDWYSDENCWTDDVFCVVDHVGCLVTFDGRSWTPPGFDHL